MQQRYYDPVIGRFYSNDPVGFSADNPMMFNRYAYANNNPYKYVDPDGRTAESFFISGKTYETKMQAVSNAWGDMRRSLDTDVSNGTTAVGEVATPANAAFVLGLIPGNGPLIAAVGFSAVDMFQSKSFSGLGGLAAGRTVEMALDRKFPGAKNGWNFITGTASGYFAGEGIKQHEQTMLKNNAESSKLPDGIKIVEISGRLDSIKNRQEENK